MKRNFVEEVPFLVVQEDSGIAAVGQNDSVVSETDDARYPGRGSIGASFYSKDLLDVYFHTALYTSTVFSVLGPGQLIQCP